VEEEMSEPKGLETPHTDLDLAKEKLRECKSLEELSKCYSALPGVAKTSKEVAAVKDEMKKKFLAPKSDEIPEL
jgi:hypothetical protein